MPDNHEEKLDYLRQLSRDSESGNAETAESLDALLQDGNLQDLLKDGGAEELLQNPELLEALQNSDLNALMQSGAAGFLPADLSLEGIMVGIFFSLVGLAYLRYGKKSQRWSIFFCGLGMLIYPYFVYNVVHILILGLGLALAPFLAQILKYFEFK